MSSKLWQNFDERALRRMDYARDFLFREDKNAAVAIFRSITMDWPEFAPAWYEIGRALDDVSSYETYLSLDPEDHLGARSQLALIGKREVPEKSAEGYVEALFDDYAHHFEDALLNRLHYQTPERLSKLLGKGPFGTVLDLGCGTGLMAEALPREWTELVGIDLSKKMLAEATKKSLYDQLEVAEITSWLKSSLRKFDLIIAADVFVYFGVLDEVVMEVARCLNPNGRLAFTVEKSKDGRDWYLRETRRYAHDARYIHEVLSQAGFRSIQIEEANLRQDRGLPIEGLYVLAAL